MQSAPSNDPAAAVFLFDIVTILRRYIFNEFMRFFLLAFAAIVSVYLCVEFLQKADDFIRSKVEVLDIIRYFFYSLPAIVTPSLPIAALLATLLSLGSLSRRNEIIAMYAGGVSLMGVIAPVVAAGALLSAFGFLNNEIIMPPAVSRANIIRLEKIEKRRHVVVFRQHNLWLRGPDNSIVNIEFTPPDRTEMFGISIYRMNPDFTVRERIRAKRLALEDGVWRLRDGTRISLLGDRAIPSSVDGEAYNIIESPEDLKLIVKQSEEMGFAELWEFVRRIKATGYYVPRYEVDLHEKIAFPFSSLVMVLIATPLSLLRPRSGGASQSIAIAVGIAFLYWFLKGVGTSLGKSGALTPFLGAWLTNALFIGAAAFIIYRMQARR